MSVPGVIAQEWRAGSLLSPSFDQVVFQSTWDGTNGGTNAIDESPIHASPLTFSNCALSNAQHLFDTACSLRCDSYVDFVSVPANALYHIGQGDFTVETFLRVPTFQQTATAQLVGVWDASNNEWRAVFDSTRMFFQNRKSAGIQQYSFLHQMLTDTWYYIAWCRYMGRLRAFMGTVGGMADLMHSANNIGPFTELATPKLHIGGNTAAFNGCNAFIQHMRVSRCAWYRTDAAFLVPSTRFGFGQIFPPLVSAPDVIYPAGIGQVLPGPMIDTDVFFTPALEMTPGFVNSPVTNGTAGVASGGPTLVGSRVNGNVLIAWIMTLAGTGGGGKTFSVGGGWTIGDQQQDANTSAAWAWRLIDGTEAAPTFTWSGACSYHARMYQFSGNDLSAPIGNKLKAQGASANLIINGGVGMTMSDGTSSVIAITLTPTSDVIPPVPPGYTALVGFNHPNGSDRVFIQPQGAAGSVSGPVNLTIPSSFWHGFMIEIKT